MAMKCITQIPVPSDGHRRRDQPPAPSTTGPCPCRTSQSEQRARDGHDIGEHGRHPPVAEVMNFEHTNSIAGKGLWRFTAAIEREPYRPVAAL
ncbi:hypothetical protein [Nocardia otitidiscaviarum]|uniref:hypothetical protein n=1 Tax=Nocardia otitidiscaviarum TaxID=1823 RepID=UPI002B4B3C0C|nr:hypothetical protein [Nocardia otitidiscaviarum]